MVVQQTDLGLYWWTHQGGYKVAMKASGFLQGGFEADGCTDGWWMLGGCMAFGGWIESLYHMYKVWVGQGGWQPCVQPSATCAALPVWHVEAMHSMLQQQLLGLAVRLHVRVCVRLGACSGFLLHAHLLAAAQW
jgi:hypothetical protein